MVSTSVSRGNGSSWSCGKNKKTWNKSTSTVGQLLLGLVFLQGLSLTGATTHYTPCARGADKDLQFFDRHNIKCPEGSGLTSWTLVRSCPGENDVKIKYHCDQLPGTTERTYKYMENKCTPTNDKGLHTLVLHGKMSCGSNQVLTQFKMGRYNCKGDDMKTKFICRDVLTLGTCSPEKSSGCQKAKGERLKYLDRQSIQCPSGKFLRYWFMTGEGCQPEYRQFKYKCCGLQDCDSVTEVSGKWNAVGSATSGTSFNYDSAVVLSKKRIVSTDWKKSVKNKVDNLMTFKGASDVSLTGVSKTLRNMQVSTLLNAYGDTNRVGCFKDDPSDRALPNEQGTTNNWSTVGCLQKCRSEKYTYAGLQYSGQCWCGYSDYDKHGVASNCGTTCTNGGGTCGGFYANNVYNVGDSRTFQKSGQAWRFDFETKDSCGASTLHGTELALTASSSQKPCCLPGQSLDSSKADGPCKNIILPCSCAAAVCNQAPASPGNSTFDVATLQCICDDQYRNIDTGGKEVTVDGECGINYELDITIGSTSLTFAVSNPESLPQVEYYEIAAYMKGSATELAEVHPGHGETVTLDDPDGELIGCLTSSQLEAATSFVEFGYSDEECRTACMKKGGAYFGIQRKYHTVCGSSSSECKESFDSAQTSDQLHEVRCCADEEKNIAKWRTCTSGGVSLSAGSFIPPNESVVANSVQDCHHNKNFREAEAICSRVGTRLCTKQELEDGCGAKSGCGHDSDFIWSSTSNSACSCGDSYNEEALATCDGSQYSELHAVYPKTTKTFTNLEPGRRYQVEFKGYNSDGQEVYTDKKRMVNVGVTHCGCSDEDYATEDAGNLQNSQTLTGTPKRFMVDQESGVVSFGFISDSRCEQAYAFTRDEDAFSPDFAYLAAAPCDGHVVKTGNRAMDDLRLSKLEVYRSYRYCVRAVAKNYMHHPTSETDSPLQSSLEICADHTVNWEASIDGRVTLAPNAGNLPVKEVTVEWALMVDTSRSEILLNSTVTTDEGGSFSIVINNELNLENDIRYPVELKFSKETQSGDASIQHIFLCDSGTTVCSKESAVVYLKHLDFDVSYAAIDDTSVPFTGKVVVADTDSPESGEGCPIPKAKVCLRDVQAAGQDTLELCSETDSFGAYSVPAVVGMRVIPEVQYYNHTFALLDWQSNYTGGVMISADKTYTNNDFKDMTKTNLFVDVAGGLCNKRMGKASVQFSIVGCQWTDAYEQETVRGVYSMPASLVRAEVVDMKDSDEKSIGAIISHFALSEQIETIDLRDLNEEDEMENKNITDTNLSPDASTQQADIIATEEKEQAETEEKLRRVRFQYDGTLTLALTVLGDTKGACTASDYLGDETDIVCDSFHAVRAASFIDLDMRLIYDISDDVTCDIVSEDLEVRLINQLGVTEYDVENWGEYDGLSQAKKDAINLCEDDSGGCLLGVQHDNFNDEKSGARAEYNLAAGPPDIQNEFIKFVSYQIEDMNYKACFVVYGDYSKQEQASIALPTHKPILLLRDPPGGMSYSSYENVQTSLKLDEATESHFIGFNMKLDTAAGLGSKNQLCLGGGLGAIALVCDELVDTKVKVKANVNGGENYLVSFDETRYEGDFTTTWSYQTSDDHFAAGRDSDTFMIPNLNVKYFEVVTISWNSTTCVANSQTLFKMNLAAQTNKPALSFVSVYDVEQHVLPKFEAMLASKQVELDDATTSNAGASVINRITEEVTALDEGLTGWNDTMLEYDLTNDMDDSSLVMPMNWFTGWVKPNDMFVEEVRTEVFPVFSVAGVFAPGLTDYETKDFDIGEPMPKDHWSALLPQNLFDRAEYLDNSLSDLTGRNDLDNLNEVNRIEFSGGGGLLEFSLKHHNLREYVSKMGKPSIEDDPKQGTGGGKNSNGAFDFDVSVMSDIEIFKVNVAFEIGAGLHYENEYSNKETTSSESETSISFVLGDGDSDDAFVVDIFNDPVYGTFLFKTISGRSMCRHESGTAYSAYPEISVVTLPAGPVLPDDPMVFGLQLKNRGVVDYRFELFTAHRDNVGLLSHLIDGDTLIRPIVYTIGAEETLFSTLTIHRGPVQYEYDALELSLRVACEADSFKSETSTTRLWNKIDADGNEKIVFAEPCPKVYWANVEDGYHVDINKMKADEDADELALTVFNPAYPIHSFAEALNTTRLTVVSLQMREVGDVKWIYTEKYVGDDIVYVDFSNEEDNYGYASAKWEYGTFSLPDGSYELKVETVCTNVEGPVSFNRVSDMARTITLDRTAPKLYGLPTPKNDAPLWPGDEVSFTFTESVLCEKPYRFSLSVTVEGIVDGVADNTALRVFDNDDLNVVCERNVIRFTFDQTNVAWDVLAGKAVDVGLTGVTDIVGNPYEGEELDHSFTHGGSNSTRRLVSGGDSLVHSLTLASIEVAEASMMFQFATEATGSGCKLVDGESRAEGIVMEELAGLLGLSLSSRIHIVSMACDKRGDRMIARVKILPINTNDEGIRRLAKSEIDLASPMHISRKLMEAVDDLPVSFPGKHQVENMRLILGSGDERKRSRNAAKGQSHEKIAGDSSLSSCSSSADSLSRQMSLLLEQNRIMQERMEQNRIMQERMERNSKATILLCAFGVVAMSCFLVFALQASKKKNIPVDHVEIGYPGF